MSKPRKYIVATRPSLLAFTQTQQTVELLKAKNPDVDIEILKITTHGDTVTDKPLTAFGGTGVFVKELENAIIDGRADFAIHSLKDVPTLQPKELILASFPTREDPRDVLLLRNGLKIKELKHTCTIGTGSPRRIVQIAEMIPTAHFTDLRGNIDTRLKKLEKGLYDGIVLAAAGLRRMGKQIEADSFLPVETCVPAVGQGVIAIECRKGDEETIAMVRSINDSNTETAILAERGYMKTIGGGCKFPMGAYATVEQEKLQMVVMLGNHHLRQIIRFTGSGPVDNPEGLGKELAEKIIKEADNQGMEIIRN